MGATLSAQVEWAATRSQESASESQQAKKSVTNHALFQELIQLIESLSSQYPQEAKTEFRRPLVWTSTSLRPSHFASSGGSTWILTAPNAKNPKASVASSAMKADGSPIFTLEQMSAGESSLFSAKVCSFDMLNRVLKVANEMKLRELQDILQANTSPINTIFGISGGSPNSVSDFFDKQRDL